VEEALDGEESLDLFLFGGFAHDPQGVLAAVQRLTLVGFVLGRNIGYRIMLARFELGVAAFAHPNDRGRSLFNDPQASIRHGCSLTHSAPLFKQFVVSGFPVSKHRRDLEARLDIESERCLVLETDVYGAIVRGEGQFHVGNDLAFGLRKPENAPVGNFLSSTGAGSFMGSHVASNTGDLVRVAFGLITGRGSFTLILLTGRGNNTCENQPAPLPKFFHS
jgi:hypothetical protein